jgi:hypothetical protein
VGLVRARAVCIANYQSGAYSVGRRIWPGAVLAVRVLRLLAPRPASIWKLREVSRHKLLDTLRGYVRRVDLFKEHAGAAFL